MLDTTRLQVLELLQSPENRASETRRAETRGEASAPWTHGKDLHAIIGKITRLVATSFSMFNFLRSVEFSCLLHLDGWRPKQLSLGEGRF